MPFQKGDPNINYQGRSKAADLVNPKSVADGVHIKNKEFQEILNKLKPLNKKAIKKLHTLLDDDNTSENGQLRAIALILKTYEDLMNEVYKDAPKGKDNKDDDDEVIKPTPFSLNRVPQSELKN